MSAIVQSAQAGAPIKSTAQFAQKPMVTLMRRAVALIDKLSPAIAARLTFELISSPPRHRPKPAEKELIKSADRWRIPFQGGWLQCYRWGSGPLCLYVHSWGGRGTQAEQLIRKLVDDGLGVVSFDHPAHGQSSGSRAEMMRMSAAIASVVHDVGPVNTLIGHSLGVAAAAIAMRDYKLSVGRLISISSLVHCMWFTEVIGDYLGISRSTLAKARGLVDRCYADPVFWEELSVINMLGHLTIPIMLIHDRDDNEIPFDHALQIKATLPNAELIATGGLGHRRVLKDADVIERIIKFALMDKKELSAAS